MLKLSNYGDITRIDLSRNFAGIGRYWTTAYLVDGMLVDTGCAHTAPELSHVLEGRRLLRILNTHTHEDHIGANFTLQIHQPGLEILAHPLALPVLADPRRRQPLHPYRRLFWGWPGASQGKPLADGQVVETEHYRFRVIFTPGHSRDHLCLYEPDQGWLFTGDLFVGGQERAVRAGHDIWQTIESLKCLATLPVDCMFPGSARVRKNPADEIAQKIAYLENLGERVLALQQRGLAVPEITRLVCGGPTWVEFVTLGHFSRRRLVLAYLGQNQEA